MKKHVLNVLAVLVIGLSTSAATAQKSDEVKDKRTEEFRRLEKEAAEPDGALRTLSNSARLPDATEKARKLVQAEPATLGIDDIIRGIEANQKAWKSQTSWMVRYTNMRERIQPPPGQMVEWPDVELVNARKGPALYIFFSQPYVGRKHESWMLWKDQHYTERTGQNAYKQDEPGPNIFSYYWYPFGLSRDLFSDAIPIPDEAFNDPQLSLVLPRCLKVNKGEYSVRKNLEEINGAQCHVLERLAKDIIWIDAKRGFNVCRRTILQSSGNAFAEVKATGWTEKTKGIWLPKRQLSMAFNFDADPKEYRGKVRFVMINTLLESRFNDLPDSFFEVPLPKGVAFEDRRKSKKE